MTEFVVIDDDPINNTIFQKIIFLAYPEAEVHVFTSPMAGFHFIKARQSAAETGEMVLFLDINMPEASGWELLERFNDFPESYKNLIKIFMISPLLNEKENERVMSNNWVSGYVVKPLSLAKLKAILGTEQPSATA